MKHLFLTIILFTLISLASLAVLFYLKVSSIEYILYIIAIMNGAAVIAFSIEKILSIKCYNKGKDKEVKSTKEQVHVETPTVELNNESIPSIRKEWSKLMYEEYSDRWNELFEKIKYPIEEGTKSEICLLCWEIASKTMDYLLVDNDDQNVLERNKQSVDAVLMNRKIYEQELKEFFVDPSTVPAKVIGVYETLVSMLTKGQKYSTQIFGYLVEISSKDE